VKQKISDEHRALDALFTATRSQLKGEGDRERASEAFEELHEALEAHLLAEENLYYPTIWAVRPERKPALQDFIRAHERFRELLGEIGGKLESGALSDVARILETFQAEFASHEVGEEEELSSLDDEISAETAR
jgi:hypothetical protein